MPTRYRLYNSSGCDLGAMTAKELYTWINAGILQDGDTIKVSKAKVLNTPIRESIMRPLENSVAL